MKNYMQILSNKIKAGETVALYCYGIYAAHLICSLEKFYGVLPAVVVDNDERKRGEAEFGVPVMPFAEARERFAGLQYFICSDDFKYSIIGDLLEKGVPPEDIVNYVPVEKRRTCLYFYNRLLLVLGAGGNGIQSISHCNADSFKSKEMSASMRVPMENGGYSQLGELLDCRFAEFERGEIEACRNCVMNREQYIVSPTYPKHYKNVACYQQTYSDCLCHCTYCCGGGNVRDAPKVTQNSLESYSAFLKSAFSLGRIDDDFTFALDLSERDYDQKIGSATAALETAGLSPMTYKINSCLLVYSERLAALMRQGLAYTVWSLDAGTQDTYRKIKQVDGFDRSVENAKRLALEDAFAGKFLIPKYLIVKNVNDNDAEFDAFLELITEMGLRFVSLSYDFYVKADENDLAFIRRCYDKLDRAGLELTYKNNSEPVTRALDMNNVFTQ